MCSFHVRSFAALIVTHLLSCVPTASSADGQAPSRAVRVVDATLAATLLDAYPASPTLRALIDELEQSDVIVHIIGMGSGRSTRTGV